VIVRRAYKFRAYPDAAMADALSRGIGCTRLVYNLALAQRQMFGRRGRRLDPSAELVALKRAFPFIKDDAFSQCLQQALRDLDTAYQAFFEGRARCPTPRRKFVNDSMRFPQPYTKNGVAIVLGRDSIKLPKFGWVRIERHRKIKGRMRNVTVTREGDRWYVVIQGELEIRDPSLRTDLPAIGLDLGINQPITTSAGEIIALPQMTKEESAHRAKLAQKLSRTRKNSAGREESRRRLQRFDQYIADRRKDARHNETTRLVKNHGLIGIEDLNVRAMTASARGTVEAPGRRVAQKAGLNRRMRDVSPGEIRRQLTYKAGWTGRILIAVSPAYTSQDCSGCGTRGHVARGERRFACNVCGAEIDRDTNAARNIRTRTITEHGRRTGGDSPWIEPKCRPETGTSKAAMIAHHAMQAGRSRALQGAE
jgi:putative transposase